MTRDEAWEELRSWVEMHRKAYGARGSESSDLALIAAQYAEMLEEMDSLDSQVKGEPCQPTES